jgi:kinesin family protein 22
MTCWVTEKQYVAGSVPEDLVVHRRTRLQAPKLPVRENDAGQIFVANLSSLPVSTEQEFQSIYS